MDELVECSAVAAHFKCNIETFDDAELLHDILELFLCNINGTICAHFACKLKAVFVYIGDNNVAGAVVFADAGGHHADGTCTRNQNIFTDDVEHQCGVRCVAVCVKERDKIIGNIVFIHGNNVGCGNAEIFCKSTITINADTLGVCAPLSVAAAAVAAVTANDMAFAGNTLADIEFFYAFAELCNFTDIFMTYRHCGMDMLLCPGIPVIYMNIRAANCGFANFDEDLAHFGFGHGNLHQFQTFSCFCLYKSIHHFCHCFFLRNRIKIICRAAFLRLRALRIHKAPASPVQVR